MSGPLAGLRVLEVGHMLAGPIKIVGQASAYALPPLLGEHNCVLAECAPSGRRRNVRPGRSTRKKAS